jgi:hypothetical protein
MTNTEAKALVPEVDYVVYHGRKYRVFGTTEKSGELFIEVHTDLPHMKIGYVRPAGCQIALGLFRDKFSVLGKIPENLQNLPKNDLRI